MLKNGQTNFKTLAVLTPLDSYSRFGRFSTLCMKGSTHSVPIFLFYSFNEFCRKCWVILESIEIDETEPAL